MKRTKILATFGPAIDSPGHLTRLIQTGVNAFRINCSHGDAAYFKRAARMVRAASEKHDWPIGLLFDISGPKLRLADFDGELSVEPGDTLTLAVRQTKLDDRVVGVNHPAVIKSVKKGERVFVDDGNLAFEALTAGTDTVKLKALNGGKILPRKGINLPDSKVATPTITSKDRHDMRTAVEAGADYIALSFVRSPGDIITARRLLKRLGGRQKIIAKLEKREAIEALEEIILLADGVMVARGDLGVELPPAEVPKLQKRIINLANRLHKPVIVATQMLESMRFAPRATRAEINDVASAVFDLADAVMLSAETATGNYPLEAVRTMQDVIDSTEETCRTVVIDPHALGLSSTPTSAIAHAVSSANQDCRAGVIYAFTTSGYTAGLISNLFPPQPVIALTPSDQVARQLTLYRSVYAITIEQPDSIEGMLALVNNLSRERRLARRRQQVIITGGAPFGSTAPTNFMLIHEVD